MSSWQWNMKNLRRPLCLQPAPSHQSLSVKNLNRHTRIFFSNSWISTASRSKSSQTRCSGMKGQLTLVKSRLGFVTVEAAAPPGWLTGSSCWTRAADVCAAPPIVTNSIGTSQREDPLEIQSVVLSLLHHCSDVASPLPTHQRLLSSPPSPRTPSVFVLLFLIVPLFNSPTFSPLFHSLSTRPFFFSSYFFPCSSFLSPPSHLSPPSCPSAVPLSSLLPLSFFPFSASSSSLFFFSFFFPFLPFLLFSLLLL